MEPPVYACLSASPRPSTRSGRKFLARVSERGFSACGCRPASSVCLSADIMICLTPRLNAHLLTRPRLCVCSGASLCVCVYVTVCMLTPVSSQLEWRLLLRLLHCNYGHMRTKINGCCKDNHLNLILKNDRIQVDFI